MKKWLLAIVFTTVSQFTIADFYVNIHNSHGIYDPSGTKGILPNTGDPAVVQLISLGYDGVYSSQLSWTLGGGSPPSFPSPIGGDDILLWSGNFQNTGDLGEDYAAGGYGTIQTPYSGSGLVLARIWNQNTMWYYEGHVQALSDIDTSNIPPPIPQSYNLGQGLDLQYAIPEPVSAVLIFVSGGLLYFKTRILGG